MMIRDDQIHAAVFGDFGLLDGGHAAVDGDDEFGALIADLGDGLGVEAVTFLNAVRDVKLDLAAQQGDGVPEDAGGGDAVDIVVAVDDDRFAVADGLGDALGGHA